MKHFSQEAKILLILGVTTVVFFIATVLYLSQDKPVVSADTGVDMALLTQKAVHATIPQDAKVTVTEFADYQCPACAKTSPALKQLMTEYQGRVNFIYRHFPLPQHQNAITTINAAEAASEQGKFWEMSELLYKNQIEWSEVSEPRQIFTKYASELGLDITKFNEDYGANKYQAIINQDLQDARELGVNSTPTLYINGIKVNSSYSYQNLKNLIEQELNKI